MKPRRCRDICLRCGICCVCRRIADLTLNFYKPAHTRCPYLVYVDGQTACSVYNTARMPKSCQAIWNRATWVGVNDTCLSAYRHNDNMKHMLWAKQHGYLDSTKVLQDVTNHTYTHLALFYRIFILPFLKNIPDTLPAMPDWLEQWNLVEYLQQMPLKHQKTLAQLIKTTCSRLYHEELPCHIETMLQEIGTIDMIQWLHRLRHALWG